MKRLTVEIEDKKHKAIKKKALNQSKTMRQVLNELLDKWLKD